MQAVAAWSNACLILFDEPRQWMAKQIRCCVRASGGDQRFSWLFLLWRLVNLLCWSSKLWYDYGITLTILVWSAAPKSLSQRFYDIWSMMWLHVEHALEKKPKYVRREADWLNLQLIKCILSSPLASLWSLGSHLLDLRSLPARSPPVIRPELLLPNQPNLWLPAVWPLGHTLARLMLNLPQRSSEITLNKYRNQI